MKYLPNILTIIRLLLVPVFIFLFFSQIENGHIYALLIFLAAGLTDLADGYIARKYNAVSKIGIVLDPLADKLMLITALICLEIYGIVPLWVLIIMIFIEGIQILAGIYLYFSKERNVIPANKFGKTATLLFTAAIVSVVILPGYRISILLLIISVFAKIFSFLIYVKNFSKKIENKN